MEHTYETPEPITAYVELGSGRLSVHAEATGTTRLEIKGPRADEFEIEFADDRLAVIAPKGRFFSGNEQHRVQLTVPEDSDLVTRMGSADTETTGPLGLLQLKTGSGDISVESASRPVTVESGSGDVRLDRLADEVRLKSGSGDVELGETHGRVGISTGSGDIVLGLVHDTALVKTGSGDLEVKRADADVSATTASGDLQIGYADHGTVTVRTASGDLRVGVPRGVPVWTDLNTVSGRVASNLEPTGKPAQGQDHLELRANTVSGDIYLVQV